MRFDVFLADRIAESGAACESNLAEIVFVGVAWFEYYEENDVDSGYFKDFKYRVWR